MVSKVNATSLFLFCCAVAGKYERGDMAMTGTAPGRSTWMVLAAVVIVIFIARFGFRIAKYFGPATHAVEL